MDESAISLFTLIKDAGILTKRSKTSLFASLEPKIGTGLAINEDLPENSWRTDLAPPCSETEPLYPPPVLSLSVSYIYSSII